MNSTLMKYNNIHNSEKIKVGLTGFEPATSGTQSPNHTKLDYNPFEFHIGIPNLSFTYDTILNNILNNRFDASRRLYQSWKNCSRSQRKC